MSPRAVLSVPLVLSVLFVLSACRRDMADQPRYRTYQSNEFFADGAAARPLPANTVARGNLREDTLFFTGRTESGELSTVFPASVTRETLGRGRERYGIACAPCHGATGDGRGMVAQRGFPAPPTFHQPRLRDAPVGHFYEVMTKGYGLMYSAAPRVTPGDRWAIAAFLRVLQQRENTPLAELTPDERATLEGIAP